MIAGCEAIRDRFAKYMPKRDDGRSDPLRVLGNARSAVVFATETPELFGSEMWELSAVNF